LAAGLFLALKDFLWVALVGRVIGWGLLVYSLTRLGRGLGIGRWTFFLAVSLWLLTGQSLMAGEWIFGGVEQKVFAYGFLILALTALLEGRGLQAGLFCGLAIAFHILVGGWGAMALGLAAVLSHQRLGKRTVSVFFGTAFALGLPFLLLSLRSQFAPADPGLAVPTSFDPSVFSVVFRNPHHLDPAVFLTTKKFLKLLVLGGCVLFMPRSLLEPGKRRILTVFFATVFGIFCMGLVARAAGLYAFLYVYPFRLGDVLIPLFFWLLGLKFLSETGRGILRYRATGALPAVPTLLLFAVALAAAGEMARDIFPNLRMETRAALEEWSAFRSAEADPFDEMSGWIREHTSPGSIFAVSPCQQDFVMRAERPVVVSFKMGPGRNGAYDWLQRLEALNGGTGFSAAGFSICGELEENFDNLTPEDLRSIAQSYSADYYLATKDRPDLPLPLLFRAGDYYLFDLQGVNRESSPHS